MSSRRKFFCCLFHNFCCCCLFGKKKRKKYEEVEDGIEPLSFKGSKSSKGSVYTQYHDPRNKKSLTEQYVNIHEKIEAFRNEKNELKEKNKRLSRNRDRIKQRLETKDIEFTRLVEKNRKMSRNIHRLRLDLERTREENERLREYDEIKKKRISVLEEENERKDRNKQLLETRIENKEIEVTGLIEEKKKMSLDSHELQMDLERAREEKTRLGDSAEIHMDRIRALEDDNTKLDRERKEYEDNLMRTERRLQMVRNELRETKSKGESVREEKEALQKDLFVAETKAEQCMFLPNLVKKMEESLSSLEIENLLIGAKELLKHSDSIFKNKKKARFAEELGSGKKLEERILPVISEMDKCSKKIRKMERALESMIDFSNQILINRVKTLTSQYKDIRKKRMEIEQRGQIIHLQLMKEKETGRVEEEKEGEEEEDLCKICFEKKKSCMFMPCKHLCCCSGCAKKIFRKNRRCPMDRQYIESIVDGIFV